MSLQTWDETADRQEDFLRALDRERERLAALRRNAPASTTEAARLIQIDPGELGTLAQLGSVVHENQ